MKLKDIQKNEWFMVHQGRYKNQWFKKISDKDETPVRATQIGKYADFTFAESEEVTKRP